ncbi:HNH endonuclease signature motif containing protein [Allobranchiibius sp. GilTou73]|uniref:HNH endonuclease signature motif containing protein n=1 Tax=Allobranchiibius sp. GilTou73 TaxID=2904523 RepID=UPI001F3A3BC3|nr:HNH endonuclease signature motif containing protein [Allobranchiibius sp. GilTou73]UIJ33683.1 HNH endonuclease [Allobranchiibius sp. GilTou73]
MSVEGISRVPDAPLAACPPVVPAGPGAAAGLLADLGVLASRLEDWSGALYQLGEAQLGGFVATMVGLATRAESLAAVATTEAVTRGTVANSTATDAGGWVAACVTEAGSAGSLGGGAEGCAPSAIVAEPAICRRIGVVATGCADPRNRVVADALAAGAVTVHCARVALREVPKVLPVIPGADREEVLSWYLALSHTGTRTLRDLSARIIGRFAPEVLIAQDEHQQACETLTWTDLPNGLTRLTADLSGGHAAVIKHAIQALSAPAPAACTGPNTADTSVDSTVDVVPERDVRTPGKRRADALMELANTAARLLDGDRSHSNGTIGGSARIIVTLDHQTLLDQLTAVRRLGSGHQGGPPGHLPGVGRTINGDLLDAGTLRRLACDADLIPAVLGGESEPLDVGRTKRLFTGGLRTAIVHRDEGCTFPGCDRPPDWCDAHHVLPWWAGGETKLTNAALLCARHHTIVHRDLLTATVTTTGVTWDLTPGLMPQRPAHEGRGAA